MTDKLVEIKKSELKLDQTLKTKAKDKTQKMTSDEIEAAIRRLIELHEDQM